MTDRCTIPCSQEGYSRSGGEITPLNTAFNQGCDIGFAVINGDRVQGENPEQVCEGYTGA